MIDDARVAALRQKFVERAREQAARIAELRLQLAQAPLVPEQLHDLNRLCHSLHGAGGTFGFDEISVAARAAEGLCDGTLPTLAPELDRALSLLLDLIGRIA